MPRAFNRFGANLWRMVSDRATDDIIAWSDDGTAFVLKDKCSVQSIAKHYGFTFTNVNSLFKQLNLYGFEFTRVKHGCETLRSFKHETFRRDDEVAAAGMRRLSVNELRKRKADSNIDSEKKKPPQRQTMDIVSEEHAADAKRKTYTKKQNGKQNEKQNQTEKLGPAVLALEMVRGVYTDSGRRVKPIQRLVPSTSTRKTYSETNNDTSASDAMPQSAVDARAKRGEAAFVTPAKEHGLKTQLKPRRQRTKSSPSGVRARIHKPVARPMFKTSARSDFVTPTKERGLKTQLKPRRQWAKSSPSGVRARAHKPEARPMFKTPARSDPCSVAASARTPSRAAKLKAQTKIERVAQDILAADREATMREDSNRITQHVSAIDGHDSSTDFDHVCATVGPASSTRDSPTERDVLAKVDECVDPGGKTYEVIYEEQQHCNPMRIRIRVSKNHAHTRETSGALSLGTNNGDGSDNGSTEYLHNSEVIEGDEDELKRLNASMHGTIDTAPFHHLLNRIPALETELPLPVHDAHSEECLPWDETIAAVTFDDVSDTLPPVPIAPEEVCDLCATLGLESFDESASVKMQS